MTPLALMLSPRPSLLLPLLGLTLLGTTGGACASDLEGLVKNSPFGGAPAKAGEEARPGNLEFRGMYVERGVPYYSIYNATTKQSVWIKQGETADGPMPFVVKAYDPETETIILDAAGQPAKAKLHSANIRTYRADVPAPASQVAPAAGVPMTVNGGVVTVAAGNSGGFNNGQPLTPEQIQAFREEMRRRFKERNGGGQGGQEGGEAATVRGSRRERGGNAGENNAPVRTK